MQYVSGSQALSSLADAQRAVQACQGRYDEAQAHADKQRAFLDKAKEDFNSIRESAVALCPALLNGYPIGETVEVVDGKITVVSKEEE